MSKRQRERHDIIVTILKLAKEGVKKTRIMQRANLSFRQLNRYLKALTDAAFLIEKDGVWKTTDKGFTVIEACQICARLLEES